MCVCSHHSMITGPNTNHLSHRTTRGVQTPEQQMRLSADGADEDVVTEPGHSWRHCQSQGRGYAMAMVTTMVDWTIEFWRRSVSSYENSTFVTHPIRILNLTKHRKIFLQVRFCFQTRSPDQSATVWPDSAIWY